MVEAVENHVFGSYDLAQRAGSSFHEHYLFGLPNDYQVYGKDIASYLDYRNLNGAQWIMHGKIF